ncbi:MAG: bifunctional (p)ppGpp synthetase/guanosine-3',5'-bis(diphosphate) 3'-pyrophosphohydrolase [bacterium]|nr:bifunctional (p)ppGpp synthetase/guanosine-3',5'-bis(diphosphate) 3'-pyrophosphohydrolase [bacterium]
MPCGVARGFVASLLIIEARWGHAFLHWALVFGMTKDQLIVVIKKNPHLDAETIERAYDVAARAHQSQKRDSGEPYITHPTAVASLLADVGMDTSTVVAGLLHDVAEDTPVTIDEIREIFGEEVAFFVEGVTKLEKIPTGGSAARTETLRKMFLATAQDIRVALIKLADRLHNMQTLRTCTTEKCQRVAQETMDIYAPLASRLGMGEWKGQLEDLAFPHLHPKEYEWLLQRIDKVYAEREAYAEKVVPIIKEHLAADDLVPLELHARPKHYWSLYQKLLAHDMDLGKVHDLVALRIIVKSVEECYRALGVLHKHFTPLPGRIKDYIALPKGSGYQSLHTTVFCVDGRITEFQIRTPAMHEEAEYGIAAHWHYKKRQGEKRTSKKVLNAGLGSKLKWIDQLQEWQKAAKGSKEFVDALKLEFLKRRIFVFTPRGDIIDLPVGATAVDFAYAIHSEIGHRCAGAKADGRIIPLSQALESGMLVEIMTRKDPQPSRDWLFFIKTSEARKKITAWIKRRDVIDQEEERAEKIELMPEEMAAQSKEKKPTSSPDGIGVVVKGMHGVLTRLAKCCSPLPGEAIEGYTTVQGGITIHKAACANLKKAKAPRHIPVSWQKDALALHPATIKVRGQTRVGLLRDVSETISKSGFNILSLTAYDTPDGEGVQIVTVEVRSMDELTELIGDIRSVKNVFSVERV